MGILSRGGGIGDRWPFQISLAIHLIFGMAITHAAVVPDLRAAKRHDPSNGKMDGGD